MPDISQPESFESLVKEMLQPFSVDSPATIKVVTDGILKSHIEAVQAAELKVHKRLLILLQSDRDIEHLEAYLIESLNEGKSKQ